MRTAIETAVLDRIKPDTAFDQRVQRVVDDLCSQVRTLTATRGCPVEPMVVGSVAKGTHLVDLDIDIFLPFPEETPREELKAHGLAVGHTILPAGQEKYSEHPYVSGMYQGFEVDIVPCYRIQDATQLKSAVDRTPFHTEYVKSHLQPGRCDQVRLFKQFLKGIGVYGANERVKGFSGYLCELMIIHAGGFQAVLEKAARWRTKEAIVLNDEQFRARVAQAVELDPSISEKRLRSALRKRYRDAAFILIDPVDPDRNVASAVSVACFSRFLHAAASYRRTPSEHFFFPAPAAPLPTDELRKALARRGTHLLALVFDAPDILEDMLYSQLRKAERRLTKWIEEEGFEISQSIARVLAADDLQPEAKTRLVIMFELIIAHLPAVQPHRGPPVWHRNARAFLEKWERATADRLAEPVIEGERWRVDVRRTFTSARGALAAALETVNIGPHLATSVEAGYEIIDDHDQLIEHCPLLTTECVAHQFPWERSRE